MTPDPSLTRASGFMGGEDGTGEEGAHGGLNPYMYLVLPHPISHISYLSR